MGLVIAVIFILYKFSGSIKQTNSVQSGGYMNNNTYTICGIILLLIIGIFLYNKK
jgi:hypothetical protein